AAPRRNPLNAARTSSPMRARSSQSTSVSCQTRRRRLGRIPMKVVALVDGEHHPAVTRWGLAAAAEAGWDVLAALVVAGGDKLDHREPDLGAVPTLTAGTEPLPRTLVRLIDELKPDAVLDLSGEPALSDPAR